MSNSQPNQLGLGALCGRWTGCYAAAPSQGVMFSMPKMHLAVLLAIVALVQTAIAQDELEV